MPLTIGSRRWKFAVNYCKHPNAIAAARKAGYSEAQAWSNSHKLKDDPDIAAYITEHYRKVKMSAEDVEELIAEVARGDVKDYVRSSPASGDLSIDGDALVRDGKGHLIEGFTPTKHGQRVSLPKREPYLRLLAQVKGMLKDTELKEAVAQLKAALDGEPAGNNGQEIEPSREAVEQAEETEGD